MTAKPNADLNVFQPQLWNFFWHKRPATSAMDGTHIPSPTDRKGGVMADPSLHNMFNFPCRVNEANDPCYKIPWHEEMQYDWMFNGQVVVDGAPFSDPLRMDKHNIDGIMNNYNWQTDGKIDVGQPLDQTRAEFLTIDPLAT